MPAGGVSCHRCDVVCVEYELKLVNARTIFTSSGLSWALEGASRKSLVGAAEPPGQDLLEAYLPTTAIHEMSCLLVHRIKRRNSASVKNHCHCLSPLALHVILLPLIVSVKNELGSEELAAAGGSRKR